MIRSLAIVSLATALALLHTHAQAQALDLSGGGPIEITAAGGLEVRDADHVAIASGDARAVRGNVTVLADQLVARYRKKLGAAPPQSAPSQAAADSGTSGNEVYRLEAHGHVRILTETDEVVGDDAIYDIDQAVLVITGKALKLTTPQQIMTARDSLEYWSQTRMAVGRGAAVVVTQDARRLAADVLVAFTSDDSAASTNASPKPATPAKPAKDAPQNPAGRLQRVEAYGNIELRTIIDTVRGDRGLYLAESGIARMVGHVRITHAGQQTNGPAADINMKTGIAHLAADPGQRVQGLIVPNSAAPASAAKPTPPKQVP